MRTDFHAILRRYARELTREEIDSLTWDGARSYYYSNKQNWCKQSAPKDLRPTICFTGFTANERDVLMSVAQEKNLKIVQSVTTSLHYLVCGPNAGPKKLAKATSQGAAVISEEDFRSL